MRFHSVHAVVAAALLLAPAWASPDTATERVPPVRARVDGTLLGWSVSPPATARAVVTRPAPVCVTGAQVVHVDLNDVPGYGDVKLRPRATDGDSCRGVAIPADTPTVVELDLSGWGLGRSQASVLLAARGPEERPVVIEVPLVVYARMAWPWLPITIFLALLLGNLARVALPSAREQTDRALRVARAVERLRLLGSLELKGASAEDIERLSTRAKDLRLAAHLTEAQVAELETAVQALVDNVTRPEGAKDKVLEHMGVLPDTGGADATTTIAKRLRALPTIAQLEATAGRLNVAHHLVLLVILTAVLTAATYVVWDGSLAGLAASAAVALLTDLSVAGLVDRARILAAASKAFPTDPKT